MQTLLFILCITGLLANSCSAPREFLLNANHTFGFVETVVMASPVKQTAGNQMVVKEGGMATMRVPQATQGNTSFEVTTDSSAEYSIMLFTTPHMIRADGDSGQVIRVSRQHIVLPGGATIPATLPTSQPYVVSITTMGRFIAVTIGCISLPVARYTQPVSEWTALKVSKGNVTITDPLFFEQQPGLVSHQ
jgi:hypothetical protein